MSEYALESIFRLYIDSSCLELKDWLQVPNVMQLYTPEKHDKEYFGDISLTLTPDQARALAKILVKKADDMEEEKEEDFYNG